MAYVKKDKMDEFVFAECSRLTNARVQIGMIENKSVDDILSSVRNSVNDFLDDITITFGPIAKVTNHIESYYLKEMNDKACMRMISVKYSK